MAQRRADDSPFARLLEEGERVVWADRPGPPRALRALGIPPRRPAHLLALALAATLLLALVLLAPEVEAPWRWALLAAAAGPAAGVALLGGWTIWRRRRIRFALTDRGRAIRCCGAEGVVFAAAPPPALPPAGEFGAIDWGERTVRNQAGAEARRRVRFEDVAYPRALLPLLPGAVPSPERGGGGDAGAPSAL